MSIKNTKPIEPKVYREMGLSDDEYNQIVDILHRHPTYTEVGMYAVMWSEHCGYKYSRPILRLFKNYKEAIDGAGLENAGVIDIGDGYGIVMKMESHNHPSAVEPFQGAATGVGGILRDIFTMGARPIACLDSLRFGKLEDPHNKFIFEHVVGGIAHYGNCVGVPTVAGDIYFDDCYSGNCLVNAMAVGILKHDDIAYAAAKGVGNPVMIVGSRTGRDGIHGATFASVELTEESESRRSNVQMGDPFQEKLLIEATLEALKTGYIVGIQDMGAAGITCSTCEMSAKGNTGMTIDCRKAPLRETGMSSYEIMLSESQERMLAVVVKGKEKEVADVFKKWGLQAVVIGEVTADELVRVYDGDELVAEVPAKSLADDVPTYYLETSEPEFLKALQAENTTDVPAPKCFTKALKDLLASQSICSKEWVYEQYDHMVQTNTAVLPGSDASVLRIKGTNKAIGLVSDCNARYCYLDPKIGAKIVVAESARNLACSGAKAAGSTDCLNFGNPEKPEAFWQFKTAVEGLAEACDFFRAPVVSGNVSFYNETPAGAIFPTPTIGMLGVIDDVKNIRTYEFKKEGDVVVLLDGMQDKPENMGGSEYMATLLGKTAGMPPSMDMKKEQNLIDTLLEGIEKGYILSAHDVSEGGVAVTLGECCFGNHLGASINITSDISDTATLFGEAQSRAVVTLHATDLTKLAEIAEKRGVKCDYIGTVGGEKLTVKVNSEILIDADVEDLEAAYRGTIRKMMESK
ncbi:MAG: phosphoribosylformylglycinamidine synthase subunit PurL [Abditibacteriota bacterium]|nr:phosphoribosylformylglycinamidine synthase subunit PurL [Abditibacteriota bacterium]